MKIDFAELRKAVMDNIDQEAFKAEFVKTYEEEIKRGLNHSESLVIAQSSVMLGTVTNLVERMFESYHAELMKFLDQK